MNAHTKSIEHKVKRVESDSVMANEPLVSVAMITYNHEDFIGHALDGILMQEVNFAYEVIIGEDKSTDRTRAIVEEYQHRYPEKIRLRLAHENLYRSGINPYFGILAACRGKYIAMCEGDDYWTDPRKLQKQVDFLEAHPDCAAVYGNALIRDEDKGEVRESIFPDAGYERHQKPNYPDRLTLRDVTWINPMPTASVMYRAEAIRSLPDWVYTLPLGDWSLAVVASHHGSLAYLDEVLAVYRTHGHGVWAKTSNRAKYLAEMKHVKAYREHLAADVQDVIQRRFEQLNESMLREIGREMTKRFRHDSRTDPDQALRELTAGLDDLVYESNTLIRETMESAVHELRQSGRKVEARSMLGRLIRRWPGWMMKKGSLGVMVRSWF